MARRKKEEVPEEAPATPTRRTLAPRTEIISPKTTGTVLVANRHTGGIVFPRKGPAGVFMKPLRLAPGTVTLVDAEEWTKYKSNRLVQHYLDHGLIAEVKRVSPVPVLTETSSDLQIPENLQIDEEAAAGQFGSAKVTKAKVGEITID